MAKWLPDYLYDPKDSLRMTPGSSIRACGYLMRIRVEELVKTRDGEVGLRRATHVASLSEIVFLSYQEAFGTGLFYSALKDRVNHRLETAHLQPQEQHFRDIGWWQSLNGNEAREELRSNLGRLLRDPPTPCLVMGIELHVLFAVMMRAKYEEYEGVITDELVAGSDTLLEAMVKLNRLLNPASAAA